MKPFLDAGFLLTLLLRTSGSPAAWVITRQLDGPLWLASLQIFNIENRLQRQIEGNDSTPAERKLAAASLQRFRWLLTEQVFEAVPLNYESAIQLAQKWQRGATTTLPALLLLWPALAVTSSATHFLSFDPRTRLLAKASGLQLLPEFL